MKQTQIVALLMPLLLGGATLLVHYLTPATVAEIGTVLGIVASVATGLGNVFVTSPSNNAVLAAAAAKGITQDSVRPPPMVGK
jgi:hypothetical protein